MMWGSAMFFHYIWDDLALYLILRPKTCTQQHNSLSTLSIMEYNEQIYIVHYILTKE